MLRQRLIAGFLLTAGLSALLAVDGWLSSLESGWWRLALPGGGEVALDRWLCQGALVTAVVLVFTLLAARELVRFFRAIGYRASGRAAQVFAAGFVIGPYLGFNLRAQSGWFDESWGLTWLALAIGLEFFTQAVRRRTQHAMVNLAATVFIIVYTGALAGYMTRLRMEVGGARGAMLLLFSLLVVKLTDVGAFLGGTLAGRHKLVEWLSPKKTWEGLASGTVLAVAASVALGGYLRAVGLLGLPEGLLGYPWGLVVFGVLMAGFSVAGDLCASLLKRDAAVKDSGQAIPGMGGFLDMLDSPLLAAPAAWFFWTRLALV